MSARPTKGSKPEREASARVTAENDEHNPRRRR